MSALKTEPREARARSVSVSDDTLTVDLHDGRTVSVPISWYPRLSHGSGAERNNWRLIGNGVGIHWPDLDEDISVEGYCWGTPPTRVPNRFNAGWMSVPVNANPEWLPNARRSRRTAAPSADAY